MKSKTAKVVCTCESMGSGIVFQSEINTDRQSCAFPAVCVLPSGRWLAACRGAAAKAETSGQHVIVSWSDDEGKTWSGPFSPFIPPEVGSSPGLFRGAFLSSLGKEKVLAALCWVDNSKPGLPFFNEETEGLLDTRIFTAESPDGGATWSMPKLMNTSPFDVPTPLTGPVLVLPDGGLACPFELNKNYYDISKWRHSAVMMFSRDGGETWPEYAITANDRENRVFYWDQRPGILEDKRILNLFWTYDRVAARYLNIHASESLDNGRTWSAVWNTGVSVQPAAPVSLPDGSVVMAYVDRDGPPEIKLRISSDYGKTWPEETEHTVYRLKAEQQSGKQQCLGGTWAEMEKFSLGLPAAASLPDGDVLVLFYAGPEADMTDVRWERIRLQKRGA